MGLQIWKAAIGVAATKDRYVHKVVIETVKPFRDAENDRKEPILTDAALRAKVCFRIAVRS